MRHSFRLAGLYEILPVDYHHAEFILKLRTDPALALYLNSVRDSLPEQQKWLSEYFDRPDDFYFVIQNIITKKWVGLISVYNVNKDLSKAEWGRWVVVENSIAAIESARLIYEFGFEYLNLSSMYCHTLADNKKVLSFHQSFGATNTGDIKICNKKNGISRQAVEYQINYNDWNQINERLKRLIAKR